MLMAVTQEEIDKLTAAYARGDLVIQTGTDRVEFASGSDMWERIQNLKRLLAQQEGTTSASRGTGQVSYMVFDKGL